MTSTLSTRFPVGQRGRVANRKGTVVGYTEIMSEGLGNVEPVPFSLLVIRFDSDQGGYLSGPGRGSDRILPQPGSRFSAYVSTFLAAPDTWVPDNAVKKELEDAALHLSEGDSVYGTIDNLSVEAYNLAADFQEKHNPHLPKLATLASNSDNREALFVLLAETAKNVVAV